MRLLAIYTQQYEQALKAFVQEENTAARLSVRREGRRGGLFYLNTAYDAGNRGFVGPLTCLLAYIAAMENPVYRGSPKMMGLARELRRTPIHAECAAMLDEYLHCHRQMHLEGYVTFRMAAFREKLDMLSYTVIKRMEIGSLIY
jgi:hypothetical protein